MNLAKLVEEVRDILRTLTASKRMLVETEIDPTVTGVVIDPAKFKQMLYNFVSNALKFTPEEGRVTIRILPEGAAAFRLEVEDTGIGIRPEDTARLFVEFQQLDSSTAKKYPGTGLGLALTKRIVEAQGGTVGVKSTPGEGSIFFATLLRAGAQPIQEVSVESIPAETLLSGAGQPAVLVVEDDARDRAWLARTLGAVGFAVQVVATGANAIAQCRQRTFDPITLDLLLPDMVGWEVLRAIRAQGLNRTTPVIVVTVCAEKEVGVGFSVHDILLKPIRAEDLVASLERAGVQANRDHTVLVIDDNLQDRKLAAETLKQLGYGAVCASDGSAALQMAQQHQPAAVILDLLMPRMDGFEFLHVFRRINAGRRVPVIVWTVKDITAEERTRLYASAQSVVLKGHGGAAALLAELQEYLPASSGLQSLAKASGQERGAMSRAGTPEIVKKC